MRFSLCGNFGMDLALFKLGDIAVICNICVLKNFYKKLQKIELLNLKLNLILLILEIINDYREPSNLSLNVNFILSHVFEYKQK